tara:strand:+ start:159 stop:338 length:180 start_codon:yes stop_codon:yes gene_type:complete
MGTKNCKILKNKKKIEEESSRKDSSDSLYSISEEWEEIFSSNFSRVSNNGDVYIDIIDN